MAHSDEKLERLTDLILVLLTTSTPIPLSVLGEELPGYPEGHEARRMAFERDKRLLREEGIFVEAVDIDGPEQKGYRIDPAKFFLPDLDLTPEEQAALNLAVAGVHVADVSGGDALRKLGMVEMADAPTVASLAGAKGVDRIFQALSAAAELRFSYRGEARTVLPVRLRLSGGHWYLAGWSKERGAGRNFRVDRIEAEVIVGAPGSGRLSEEQSVAIDAPDEPWVVEGSPTPTTLLTLQVDALYAWRVVDEVGEDRVSERRADGSIVVEVAVGREDAARSWVLSLLDHAQVLAPAPFVEGLRSWLDAVIAQRHRIAEAVTLDDLEREDATGVEEDRAKLPETQRRLRRLLAMLEWLAEVGTVSTATVAERFAMSPEEVVAELELAACCGRPPFSPGELMDIIVDADQVTARLPEMSRPRQLTPAEGIALAAAAKTILALPGADLEGPLARAVVKLDLALGEREALEVALDQPAHLEQLRRAADEGRRLEVEYLASSTDELTTRTIDPLRVTAVGGHWYVEAFCHRADALRTFRADSFKRVSEVGDQDRAPSPLGELPRSFIPEADSVTAFIRVGPEAAWLADSVPVLGRCTEPEGSVLVALSVSGRAWFERVLLQAGPHAAVVAPAELLDVAADAAARLKARYEPTV
jgi:proteasome accessory factor C